MNICIPVIKDKGLQSRISPHFGSAPLFMMVDTESGECRALANQNRGHAHGKCRPLASLAGEDIQGVVVGGMGPGALNKLNAAGIEVFLSDRKTVEETLAAFKEGILSRMTADVACGHGHGHGHGGGCSHGRN